MCISHVENDKCPICPHCGKSQVGFTLTRFSTCHECGKPYELTTLVKASHYPPSAPYVIEVRYCTSAKLT